MIVYLHVRGFFFQTSSLTHRTFGLSRYRAIITRFCILNFWTLGIQKTRISRFHYSKEDLFPWPSAQNKGYVPENLSCERVVRKMFPFAHFSPRQHITASS